MLRDWTCPACNTKLGIRNGNKMELKYKTMKYIVNGAESIEAVCRKCGRKVKSSCPDIAINF